MPFTDLVLAVVEATWQHSIPLFPILILFATAVIIWKYNSQLEWRHIADGLDSYTRVYGIPIILGATLGGTASLAFTGTLAALAVAAGIGIGIAAAAQRYGLVTPRPAHPGRRALWLAAPVIAAAGLVLDHTLLQHLIALLVYGAVFWDV